LRRSLRLTKCLKLHIAAFHMRLKIRELPEGVIVPVPGTETFAVRRGARYMSTETSAHMRTATSQPLAWRRGTTSYAPATGVV
jgi:hypothetical protein